MQTRQLDELEEKDEEARRAAREDLSRRARHAGSTAPSSSAGDAREVSSASQFATNDVGQTITTFFTLPGLSLPLIRGATTTACECRVT
mgnify:CR=1 FL=1